MFKLKEYDFKNYKVSILFLVLLLGSIGGYLMQYLQKPGERLFEKHIIGLIIGAIIAVVVSMVDYHFICKFFIPMYLISNILLFMVKFSKFGGAHHDAKRWIRFPNGQVASTEAWFEIQPSELTKIIMIIFIAKFFDIMKKQINKWYVIVIAGILMIIPILFIFMQPDLSTSIVLGITFIVMVFIAGISYKFVIPALIVAIPAIMGLYWYIQQPFQSLIEPYQQDRILSIKYPELYPDEMWQQNNAAKAIKSGGMVGKIFTENVTTLDCASNPRIPAIESDFIFTAIAEGFGFIGCCVVLFLYAIFIYQCLLIGKNAKDKLGTFIALGISTLIMTQMFVNIGVVTSLLPNTGIPLPFVSSGLSSLLSGFLMIGLLLNIGLQHKINKEVK